MLVLGDSIEGRGSFDLMWGPQISIITNSNVDCTPPVGGGADCCGLQLRRAKSGSGEFCGFQIMISSTKRIFWRGSWNAGNNPSWTAWKEF